MKTKKLTTILGLIFSAFIFLGAFQDTGTNGNILYVDNTGSSCNGNSPCYPTIQDAIDAAEDGDTVLVYGVPNKPYKGARNKNLDFNQLISTKGKIDITVESVNGAEDTIIDCENGGRGFIFQSGETNASVLDGFTIRNGALLNGGGIYFRYNSSPTILNCIIEKNKATGSGSTGNGGGIYCKDNSSPVIEYNAISDNSAGSRGGGIHCEYSSPQISNNTISGNKAIQGAGISVFGATASPIISYNTISGNHFEDSAVLSNGGGIWCGSSTTTILSNKI
ncbi:MAG: right-handed parallel beta-helix repeat-containing protein [Candidatus Aminicenantes bacterium]|nr:MAG: right-handed parallel beta-helix repeat-containing protein [Candidatus Aminicenantes bacterium]